MKKMTNLQKGFVWFGICGVLAFLSIITINIFINNFVVFAITVLAISIYVMHMEDEYYVIKRD